MAKSLKDFFVRFASVVDKGDNPEANIMIVKSKGGESMKLEDILKELDEEKAKVINDELAAKDAKISELEKVEPKKIESEPEQKVIEKADPEIKAFVEKMQKEKDEMIEKLSKMESTLRKDRIEKEVSEFDKISAKNELIDVLTDIDDRPDTAIKLKTILKAVNEALSQNTIMKTVGVDGEGKEEKVMETVDKKAKELVEKEHITIEEARTRVFKSDPKLYEKYLEE
jgi:ATPase subunit of ABC transporter with duplicated ATPase domains